MHPVFQIAKHVLVLGLFYVPLCISQYRAGLLHTIHLCELWLDLNTGLSGLFSATINVFQLSDVVLVWPIVSVSQGQLEISNGV